MHLPQIRPLRQGRTLDELAPAVRIGEARVADGLEDVVFGLDGEDGPVEEAVHKGLGAGLCCGSEGWFSQQVGW